MLRTTFPQDRNLDTMMIARTLAALALASLALPASAQQIQSFRVDYSVSILGLNVARSTFTSTIGPNDFHLKGTLASSGIAKIFDSTEGTMVVRGAMGDGVQADAYLLSYTSGDKKKRTSVSFSNGAVTKAENVPVRKINPKRWVPLDKSELTSVTDPISASMVRAASLRDVCNRTIRVFDGEMRADLKLSFVGVKPAEAKGFSGEAVTCRAQFVPIGGYKISKSVDFMKNKSKIMMTFAPLGTTGVYAPIHVTATTEIGTLTIAARRFETVNQ
jgi:hypothetical protein